MSWIVTPRTIEWPDTTLSGLKLIVIDEKSDVPFPLRGCGHNWTRRDRIALLDLDRAIEYRRQPENWRDELVRHPIFTEAADAINRGLGVRGEFAVLDVEGSLPEGKAHLLVRLQTVGYQIPATLSLYWRLLWDSNVRIVRAGLESEIANEHSALKVSVKDIKIRKGLL